MKHHRINSLFVVKYLGNFETRRIPTGIATTVPTGMTPYIIEERKLNVAQMDVFSRLMMDRIIFLGDAIYEHEDSAKTSWQTPFHGCSGQRGA